MNPPSHCLECNAPLTAADAGGLCPKCLLRLGLASQLASGTLPATAPGLTPDGAVREPFDFGAYRILRLLGKGGMGAVYEAEHAESGRRVALKVLGQTLDTPEMRARFIREGQLAAGVRHANVVAVLAAEEIEGAPVIAMELLHDGTLRDRVKARGPLPTAEAVDAVLQIIEGLEAAHAVGVLHRDVKPANCFTAADGTVKVGDFGLSISTLVKAENTLTQSGAVLGTPAFAAPEQLRGQDIDARADIYAVGATLYFLLTGKPTHDAEALVALIASVLEKKPDDVRVLSPKVPRALAAAVMRCLEKDPGRRFASYAALRAALMPFCSAAPTPAMLGLRFAAGLLDVTFAYLPGAILAVTFFGEMPELNWLKQGTVVSFLWFFANVVWLIGWFAVPEALWGRSLGKALCGVRVVRVGGGAIGWGAAVIRSAMLWLHDVVPYVATALLYSTQEYRRATEEGGVLGTELLFLPLLLVLFVTMRRRNGYATLYDLATATRVVVDHRQEGAEPVAETPAFPIDVAGIGNVGPFVLLARNGYFGEAFDPVLRRRVWLRFAAEGAPVLDALRRDLSRSTRLRWLQSRRSAESNWDAYEKPAGAPLGQFSDSAQPWSRVRVWLADLAQEFNAALADGTLPAEVALDRVWITAAGSAVLLDFPAPGAPVAPLRPVRDAAEMQEFLHEVAAATASPRMPLHAREFLSTLRQKRLEASALISGNLAALRNRPASANLRSRVLSLALLLLVVVSSVLVGLTVWMQARWSFDEAWAAKHPGQTSPRMALELMSSDDSRAVKHHSSIAAHLAARHGDALIGDAFWQSREMQGLLYLDVLRRSPVESEITTQLTTFERQRKAGSRAIIDHAATVEPLLARRAIRESIWYFVFATTLYMLAVIGVLAAILAFVLRAPPGLRLFGLALVRSDGAPAGRFRVALRTLIAWAPVFIAAMLLTYQQRWFWETSTRFPMAGVGVLAFMVTYWLSGLAEGRGPAEKATRTWIVPL
jgi:uncharacterized RDD family membrane protein YckC